VYNDAEHVTREIGHEETPGREAGGLRAVRGL